MATEEDERNARAIAEYQCARMILYLREQLGIKASIDSTQLPPELRGNVTELEVQVMADRLRETLAGCTFPLGDANSDIDHGVDAFIERLDSGARHSAGEIALSILRDLFDRNRDNDEPWKGA